MVPVIPSGMDRQIRSKNGIWLFTILRRAVSRSNQAARSTSGNVCVRPERGGHSSSNVLLTMRSASRSPATANAAMTLRPDRTVPSSRSSPAGTGEPSSSANSRRAAARGASDRGCSPFGMDHAPSSLRAQNGPPMCASSTWTAPSGPVRCRSTPAERTVTCPPRRRSSATRRTVLCPMVSSQARSRPPVVPPGDPLLEQAHVVVRAAEADGEERRARIQERVADLLRGLLHADRALDLGGVAADVAAVTVEDAVLAPQRVDVAEAVPDLRVLGGVAEGLLLPAAPDQDRDVAGGGRVEL